MIRPFLAGVAIVAALFGVEAYIAAGIWCTVVVLAGVAQSTIPVVALVAWWDRRARRKAAAR